MIRDNLILIKLFWYYCYSITIGDESCLRLQKYHLISELGSPLFCSEMFGIS